MNQKTNIVYFTTTCNLACTYCYQHVEDYPHRHSSTEELEKIAIDTIKREDPKKQTLFVLFGGEPTVRWEQVKFFMDTAYSLKQDVQFNMVTNGIRFLDDTFLRDFLDNNHYKEGRLQIEVSFDGQVGNKERIYPNKKESTNDVLEVLFKLKEINTRYRIRYTIHKNNIGFIEDDLEKIEKFFNPERIILNEFEASFNEEEIKTVKRVKANLINKYYNKDIKVPICMKNNEMCSVCNQCDKSIKEFSLHLGADVIEKNHVESGKFNDFK